MLESLARQSLGQAVILIINPVISLKQAIARLRKGSIQEFLLFGRAKRLTRNLYVGTPIVWRHGRRRHWKNKDLSRWRMVSRQIQKAAYKIVPNPESIVSWVYRPEQLHCLDLAKENFAIYECYDEYSLSHIDGSLIPGAENEEKNLMNKVDLIFTTSYPLFESRRKKHPNVHYAPNGVDFDLFNQATRDELLVADDLKEIPMPRLGFIGNLSRRIDFNLLEKIALHNNKWSLVLIGPVEREVKKDLDILQQQRNVHYLGYKLREILPQYLKGFDACILPFKMHDWNECSNPLKLWEYMAAGIPVVSTPTIVAEQLKDIIYVGHDKEEFVTHLHSALASDNMHCIKKGIEMARMYSWDTLTSEILGVIREELVNS
jgi:glycosyltransferase involved in cell wall biosynthesis